MYLNVVYAHKTSQEYQVILGVCNYSFISGPVRSSVWTKHLDALAKAKAINNMVEPCTRPCLNVVANFLEVVFCCKPPITGRCFVFVDMLYVWLIVIIRYSMIFYGYIIQTLIANHKSITVDPLGNINIITVSTHHWGTTVTPWAVLHISSWWVFIL